MNLTFTKKMAIKNAVSKNPTRSSRVNVMPQNSVTEPEMMASSSISLCASFL